MKEYIRHIVAIFAAFFGSQATVSPISKAQDQESQIWAQAESAGTIRAYEDYLAEYPVGRYSREAFVKILRLSKDNIEDIAICDTIEPLDYQTNKDDCKPISALY